MSPSGAHHGIAKWGGAAIKYLFRDDLTGGNTSSPRTATPGPGSGILVDSAGAWSVANGLIASKATAGHTDPGYRSGALARVTGRLFSTKVRQVSAYGSNSSSPGAGWSKTTDTEYDHLYGLTFGATWSVATGSASTPALVAAPVADTDYILNFVARSNGVFSFVGRTLLWIGVNGNEANLYAAVGGMAANRYPPQISYMRVRDLTGAFATNNGIATLAVGSPVNANAYVGDADVIADLTLTAAGTILTEAGLRFRVQDASNYWRMYFNTTGAFRVDSIASGTPTNRVNVAGVIAGSATVTMRVIANANKIAFYTLSGTTWTKQGTTLTSTTYQAQTGLTPDFGVEWTASNLFDFPVSSTLYNVLPIS